jgi:hypothetical protein
VFVTSTTHTGDIGGLAAADALCQEHASNALMTSTFKAWLSSGSENAFDRMTGNGPWYTTHSALAFKDKLALRQGTLADITDESGSKPSLDVWSGSDGLGDASGQDCKGWTSAAITDEATTGSTFTNDGRWGGGGSAQNCDVPRAIICFEQ